MHVEHYPNYSKTWDSVRQREHEADLTFFLQRNAGLLFFGLLTEEEKHRAQQEVKAQQELVCVHSGYKCKTITAVGTLPISFSYELYYMKRKKKNSIGWSDRLGHHTSFQIITTRHCLT